MMMVLGPLLFMVMFLAICGQTRDAASGLIDSFFHWLDAYRPVSYAILMGLGVAALISTILVIRWPGTPEPDNPLAQYLREHPEMDE